MHKVCLTERSRNARLPEPPPRAPQPAPMNPCRRPSFPRPLQECHQWLPGLCLCALAHQFEHLLQTFNLSFSLAQVHFKRRFQVGRLCRAHHFWQCLGDFLFSIVNVAQSVMEQAFKVSHFHFQVSLWMDRVRTTQSAVAVTTKDGPGLFPRLAHLLTVTRLKQEPITPRYVGLGYKKHQRTQR